MSTFKGLAALNAKREEVAERQEAANAPRANWFKLKNNETKVVYFLNELDEEAPNYNPEYGTYLGAVEHQAPGPKGFMSRALDTQESEGRDWAQEMYESDRKKYADFRPRENFYINVAVIGDDGEPEAQILSRSMANSFIEDLAELYDDEGTITGFPVAIKRRGVGLKSEWRMKKVDPDKEGFDISGVQPWDLSKTAVRHVPYAKQKEYYERNMVLPEDEDEKPSEQASEDVPFDW